MLSHERKRRRSSMRSGGSKSDNSLVVRKFDEESNANIINRGYSSSKSLIHDGSISSTLTFVDDLDEIKENDNKNNNKNSLKSSSPQMQPPKMSSKRRMRLEKFINAKLRKEERIALLAKLSTSSFTCPLLRSSSNFGDSKETRKIKLRRGLLEEKHGLQSTVSDLYVPVKEIEEISINQVLIIPKQSEPNPKKKKKINEVVSLENKCKLDEQNANNSIIATIKKTTETTLDTKTEKKETTATETTLAKNQTKFDNKNSILSIGERKKRIFEIINRPDEMQKQRLLLPVCQEECQIMELINSNPVVVISGETGSGKTTQVPQFLYEYGYSHSNSDYPGLIGVTQPRRVAAIAMSQRVGKELCKPNHVSYQIRFEKTTTVFSRIHFMTDGVLLNEISADFLLLKYSVIILDEAHERNLNTDILIGVLSRIVRLRATIAAEEKKEEDNTKRRISPLKIIIMSATLRVTDFTQNSRLFSTPPPVITVEARQFPVTVHFNRKTNPDHLSESYKRVCQIHSKLPPGGILVFLPGQSEIYQLIRKLEKKYNQKSRSKAIDEFVLEKTIKKQKQQRNLDFLVEDKIAELDRGLLNEAQETDELLLSSSNNKDNSSNILLSSEKVVIYSENSINNSNQEIIQENNEPLLYDLSASDEEDNSDNNNNSNNFYEQQTRGKYSSDSPLWVLPLYSLLSSDDQMKVFEQVPKGYRLCVVATNVAETSLTIPGINYVVDCGKVKEKFYDSKTSIESFLIKWVSKASAGQRAGRAGRTGPGHCYRLYSSAVYENQFEQFTLPEILRMPIETVVLRLKAMNIDKVVNFPFPTSPEVNELATAEKLLQTLGALDSNKKVTKIGSRMNGFPLHPRLSKILLLAIQNELIEYAIVIVSSLCVGDIFLSSNESINEELNVNGKQQLLQKFTGKVPISDALLYLRLVGAFAYNKMDPKFCLKNNLRYKAMQNIIDLYRQLTDIVITFKPNIKIKPIIELLPPNLKQSELICQLIFAGFTDHVAVLHPNPPEQFGPIRHTYYQSLLNKELLCIDRGSVLHSRPPAACVFHRLQQGTTNVWMKTVTKIELSWVPKIAGNTSILNLFK